MELIIAEGLGYHNGTKDIIMNGSFRILEGRKYGLIGPNGSGKTTLIRMITGELKPDEGRLKIKTGLKYGYLPQQPEFNENLSINDFLTHNLTVLLDKMNEAAEKMSLQKEGSIEELLSDYQKSSDKFEAAGGYEAIERAEQVLRKLGLDNPMEQNLGSLSGGERSLVFFARAILSGPELLILDEPGNHLDYLGLAWLESFINGYKGAVIIVSHNRYLLDKTCSTIIGLEKSCLTVTSGTYSDYKVERYKRALIEQSEWEAGRKLIDSLEKKIKELQSIAMSQYNPPAAVMAQLGDAKMRLEAEKKRHLEKPDIDSEKIQFVFGDGLSRSSIAVRIKNFSLSFGERVLFDDADLEIKCGEKVALIGSNGSGKTTLINTVLKYGEWHNRDMQIGPSQVVGYLSQTAVFNENAHTIEDEIRSWGALSRDGAFSIASQFSFKYEDLEKDLSVLSGGEVNRLQLARLMYLKTNFLVLDEPTNHMDIKSREAIEEAVSRFKGTVLVVSHDRYFLDQLVDRVVEIDKKKLVTHEGNFSKYFRAKYPVLPRLSGNVAKRGAERRKTESESVESVVFLENRIAKLEKEKTELERELEASFSDKNRKAGLKSAVKLEKLNSMLEKLYTQWENLA